MAIIKSYSDWEQSKKLAEILPLESADMYYDRYGTPSVIDKYVTHESIKNDKYHHLIPCWSLAVLFSVLPIVYTNNKKEICGPLHIDITDSETPFVLWYINPLHKGNIVELKTKEYDNLVDACYEMIMRLHELKML